jgi:hypothetical protein
MKAAGPLTKNADAVALNLLGPHKLFHKIYFIPESRSPQCPAECLALLAFLPHCTASPSLSCQTSLNRLDCSASTSSPPSRQYLFSLIALPLHPCCHCRASPRSLPCLSSLAALPLSAHCMQCLSSLTIVPLLDRCSDAACSMR